MINWNSKFYNIMKYILTVGVGAFTALYCGLCALYGWQTDTLVCGTVGLFATFFGTLLNISSNQYWKAGGDS